MKKFLYEKDGVSLYAYGETVDIAFPDKKIPREFIKEIIVDKKELKSLKKQERIQKSFDEIAKMKPKDVTSDNILQVVRKLVIIAGSEGDE